MFASQLRRLIESDNHMKKQFVGIYSKDKLPLKTDVHKKTAYIINTAVSKSKGEHWILVFVHPEKRKVIWFDSFAEKPEYYGKQFLKWLLSFNLKIEVNQKLVQPVHSQYCGLYVLYVFFYLSRNLNFNTIIKRFSSNLIMNDYMVSNFAWKHFHFNARKDIEPAKTSTELYKKNLSDIFLIFKKNYF